jgi:hypothetical protein
MTEPEIVWEVHKLHGHWVGDHSDCRPGGHLCAEQDAKLAKRRGLAPPDRTADTDQGIDQSP